MCEYKRIEIPDNGISYIANDFNNRVEFVIKKGIPVYVVYGKRNFNMKRDIGVCEKALSMLIKISMDAFIELVQELNHNTFCYRKAICMLTEIINRKNIEYTIQAEQMKKINKILETAPK